MTETTDTNIGDIASRPNALFDAEGSAAIDRWAIEEMGIPSLELMENAGRALADAIVGLDPQGLVSVVVGKGNNGGDGLVAARLLSEMGFDVEVLSVFDPASFSTDAAANREKWGGPLGKIEDGGWRDALSDTDVVVDCIFGTGFTGVAEGTAAEAISAINGCGATVVAADVPSGVDISKGTADLESSVIADLTVTFNVAKLGHWVHPGKEWRGELLVAPIGIPPFGSQDPPALPVAELLDGEVLGLARGRGPESTKFSSGQVLIVGGSTGMSGAVCLAAAAAMRTGAGYVRLAVPRNLVPIVETKLTETMTVPLAGDDRIVAGDANAILAEAENARCVVIGSGAGRDEETLAEIRKVVMNCPVPLVLDADGINAFAGHLDELAHRNGPQMVITPHEGEVARLFGRDIDEISDERLDMSTVVSALSGAVAVLKGDDTIINEVFADGQYIAVAPGDSPALATAGTGDVLSGMIAALIARHLDAFDAACAAVWAHQEAGRIAEEMIGSASSVVAGDVIAALPQALAAAHGGHVHGPDCDH